MPTLDELLAAVEARTFVGRHDEVATVRGWLDRRGTPPAVLEVVGRGGIGKTALARAAVRLADDAGLPVVQVDGSLLRPDPASLATALGAATLADAAAELNRRGALVVLDGFEHVAGLRRPLLDELLPALDARVRVLVAGRVPLVLPTDRTRPWTGVVRRLELGPFDPQTARDYLARRGVDDRALAADILGVAAGHPLALAVAADIADLGASAVAATADWDRALRAMGEQLVREVADPDLRAALQAASVVRRFDVALLEAMTERPAGAVTEQLGGLALVRRGADGARIHDDVRAILAADLQARDPARFATLRRRALAHYRDTARRATPLERDRLLLDAFFLAEDTVLQTMVFGDQGHPGEVLVEPATTAVHLDEAMRLETVWHHEVLPAMGHAPGGELYDGHDHLAEFGRLVRHPHARVWLARDEAGTPVGFMAAVPVTASSHEVLAANPVIGPTIRSVVADGGGVAALPAEPADARIHHLTQLAVVGEPAGAIQAALWREMLSVMFEGGLFSVTLAFDEQAALLETLGFSFVEGSRVAGWARDAELIGLVLDLRDASVADWVADRVLPLLATTPASDGEHAGVSARVRLLGEYTVERDGATVTPAGMAGQLLRLVALRSGPAHGPVHVEEVAEELWPDADPGQGRTRLRNVLTRLRDACGDVVCRDGDGLRLADDVEVDLHRFDAACDDAVARLRAREPGAVSAGRRALALGAGELLPGDPYAGWAAVSRERHHRRRLALLDALAQVTAEAGDVTAAVEMVERAIDLEPYDEFRYVRAAQLLVDQGRRGAAATLVDRAGRMLGELDVAPSPPLVALRREVAARR